MNTTYFLRSLGASKIESSLGTSGKTTRGVMSGEATVAALTKTYTEAEKKACSIAAMLNGGECEACQ